MSKKIVILFSGGLDSTYLMWKALKAGHEVYPTYISINNNQNKVIVEKQQCTLLINEFNKEFDKKIELNETVTVDVNNASNLAFSQPYLWSTLANIGIYSDMDEIQIGYVYGDSVIAYIPEIKKNYNSAKPFVLNQPKLTFPFIKTSKEVIIEELPEQYLKLVVSCENPKLLPYGINNGDFKYRFFEPCGDCEVCKKIMYNDYYGCEVTKKNYTSAEKIYNESKYNVFKFKYKKDIRNFSEEETYIKEELKEKEIRDIY